MVRDGVELGQRLRVDLDGALCDEIVKVLAQILAGLDRGRGNVGGHAGP